MESMGVPQSTWHTVKPMSLFTMRFRHSNTWSWNECQSIAQIDGIGCFFTWLLPYGCVLLWYAVASLITYCAGTSTKSLTPQMAQIIRRTSHEASAVLIKLSIKLLRQCSLLHMLPVWSIVQRCWFGKEARLYTAIDLRYSMSRIWGSIWAIWGCSYFVYWAKFYNLVFLTFFGKCFKALGLPGPLAVWFTIECRQYWFLEACKVNGTCSCVKPRQAEAAL